MKYTVIFTTGYTDDIDSLSKELKCDVLILTEHGDYYNPQFITLNRIIGEFTADKTCYLEDNVVILHSITKETIIESIKELHNWRFMERWIPISKKQLEDYFYPKYEWVNYEVII